MNNNRGNWSSKLGFILAATGSAIGLGNIWRFPYITGSNGGAAFVLIYLFFVILVGLPILFLEISIGRHTNLNAVGAFGKYKNGKKWKWIGYLGVLSGFVVLSYYSVIAGWTMHYIVKSATNLVSDENHNYIYAKIIDENGNIVVPSSKDFWKTNADNLSNTDDYKYYLDKNNHWIKISRKFAEYEFIANVSNVGNGKLFLYLSTANEVSVYLNGEKINYSYVKNKWYDLNKIELNNLNNDNNEIKIKVKRTAFSNIDAKTGFVDFISNPYLLIFWHLMFLLLTAYIVAKGVADGIERFSKVLMPILFLLLIGLIIRALTLPGAFKGVNFYLKPDFSSVTYKTFFTAMGQAFFSLSLGFGAMITYGSYTKKDDNIISSGAYIAGFDTLVAFLAGLVIFPALFAFNMNPEAGPSLVFVVMPVVFSKTVFGSIVAFIFFLLLFIAAITSSISLLEIIIAYVVDEKKWDRFKGTFFIVILVFIFGIPSALSFNVLSKPVIGNMTFFDFLDKVFFNLALPINALGITIFCGYIWGINNVIKELTLGGYKFYVKNIFVVLVKYIIPLLILTILVMNLLSL